VSCPLQHPPGELDWLQLPRLQAVLVLSPRRPVLRGARASPSPSWARWRLRPAQASRSPILRCLRTLPPERCLRKRARQRHTRSPRRPPQRRKQTCLLEVPAQFASRKAGASL